MITIYLCNIILLQFAGQFTITTMFGLFRTIHFYATAKSILCKFSRKWWNRWIPLMHFIFWHHAIDMHTASFWYSHWAGLINFYTCQPTNFILILTCLTVCLENVSVLFHYISQVQLHLVFFCNQWVKFCQDFANYIFLDNLFWQTEQ